MSAYNRDKGTVFEYIEWINTNFIYTLPVTHRREILVLGAGGFTIGLNDTFHSYTFIDIEKTLKDVTEQKFLDKKLTPNKKFIVQDASQFLKNTSKKYDVIILDVFSNTYQVPESFITAEFMERMKSRVADNGVILMNVAASPSFADPFTQTFDNTFHSVFKNNAQRQIMGNHNPWDESQLLNLIYIYHNRPNSNRIYTINKTPVIYDKK